MTHHTPIRFVIRHWELFAMQDGLTLHETVIDAEPVAGGFVPAFTGRHGIRVIVETHPRKTPDDARIALRDVLWGAHVEGRISLLQHPVEAQSQAAA